MNIEAPDPRDIPILTDAIEKETQSLALFDTKGVHAGIVTETLKLADSLLHQAAKDIEATLFERVLDQLRATLPELVDRVLREHTAKPGQVAAVTVETTVIMTSPTAAVAHPDLIAAIAVAPVNDG